MFLPTSDRFADLQRRAKEALEEMFILIGRIGRPVELTTR